MLRLWSGKDLREVYVSGWWNAALNRGRLRDGGTSGMAGYGGASGWTLGIVNFSGEALCSLDTCHHPDAG